MTACTTTYQSKRCNERTKQMYAAANKMVRRPVFGSETSDITMVQGSCNTGVSQSAGTHDDGATDDCTAFNQKNRVRVFRLLGQAKWYRTRIPGLWEPHCHGVNDHDSSASKGAKDQVAEYHRRGDGLRGNLPDTGYRMLVFPEFVVNGKVGTYYCTAPCGLFEQPTGKSKRVGSAVKGAVFTVVAVLKVGSQLWLINIDGKCATAGHFSRTKPVAVVKAVSKIVYTVIPADLYAKDAPSWDAKTVATVHKGQKITGAFVGKGSDGLPWVENVAGDWFAKQHLKEVTKVVMQTNLRPMTYNLPDESKLPNAEARVPAAVALTKTGKPTFVLMQECVGIDKDGHASEHSLAIDEAFGANWGAVIPTLPFNENYIWYDSTLLTLVKRYPDAILTSPGGGRHITRAVFKHKKTGLVFAVGNTHLVNDHDGVQYEESRQSQGFQAMKTMLAISVLHGDCPIIIGGDMNTVKLIEGFIDGGLQSVAVGAAEETNLGYQSYAKIGDDTPNVGAQIDQLYASKVFTMGGISVLLGLDASGTWPALRPSDHVPVVGSITK